MVDNLPEEMKVVLTTFHAEDFTILVVTLKPRPRISKGICSAKLTTDRATRAAVFADAHIGHPWFSLGIQTHSGFL
jgi:hypothetical protein